MSNENKNRPSSLPRHILGDRELETYLKLIKRDRMRDKGKAKSPPIRKMDFTSQRSNTTKDTIYTPWLTPTIRSGIGFDYNTTSPLEGLAKGAIASILQGVRHISPLDDSYYTTPPGGRTVALSGTLLYVDSNDQTFMVDANRIFGTTTECGYISLLFQGLDISDDGERLYYVMDSSYMKVWYDESDLSLNFNPDAVNNNRVLSITLPSGDGGWFGKGKHEIFISWDFAQQVFELWFDENRATYSVNAGDATKPKFTSTDIITFVNSDPTTDDADAGLLNMYGMIDEIQMVGDFPPLRIITSLDGVVSSSLYPVHSGTQSTACSVASATPINLGTIEHPFDNLVVKTATVLCGLTGGSSDDEKVKVSATDTTTDYLENKLVSGSGITLTVVGGGGDETLSIATDSTLLSVGPTTVVVGEQAAINCGAVTDDPLDFMVVVNAQNVSGGPAFTILQSMAQVAGRITYNWTVGAGDLTVNIYNDSEVDASIMVWYGSPSLVTIGPHDVRTVNANTTATTADKILYCTSGAITVTLYTAVGNTGRDLYIDNASVGIVTVDGDGVETIEGELTQTLVPDTSIHIYSTGAGWRII